MRHAAEDRAEPLDRVMTRSEMGAHLRGRLRLVDAEIEALFGQVSRGASRHDPQRWWEDGANAEWVRAWSKLNYLLHFRDDLRRALGAREAGLY